MDQPTLDTRAIMFVEVGAAEIVVEVWPGQQPVSADRDSMADGDNRFLLPAPRDKSSILSGEVTVLLSAGGLGCLRQGHPQPDVAFARLTAQTFAGAVVIARTPASPGRQVCRTWETLQIGADLGEQHFSGTATYSRDPIQPIQLIVERAQPLGNLRAEPSSGLVRVRSSRTPEEYHMMSGGTMYANPSALVSTNWVSQHLDNFDLRLLEVDVDTTAYDRGHLRGAPRSTGPVGIRGTHAGTLIASEWGG